MLIIMVTSGLFDPATMNPASIILPIRTNNIEQFKMSIGNIDYFEYAIIIILIILIVFILMKKN